MQAVIFFIISLAILIVIHEYGHFWVARRCGVKVLRFSVGFGKTLWKKTGRDGTEYILAAIPLGGYVKMLDERETKVDPSELAYAFNRQSLKTRIAIVAAGPIANLLFAILIYWLLFVTGIPGLKPLIAEVKPDSIAEQAGLLLGDELKTINGKHTPTLQTAYQAFVQAANHGERVDIVTESNSVLKTSSLMVPQLGLEKSMGVLDAVGLQMQRPSIKPVIGQILPDSPAQQAGLQVGDELRAANGKYLNNWTSWVKLIQASAGQSIQVLLSRNGQLVTVSVKPEAASSGLGKIGAGVDVSKSQIPEELKSQLRYSPIIAVKEAILKTWQFSLMTLSGIGGMITGAVSTDNIGGPISIAQLASNSAEQGIISFLSFLAMISITLGVLNLLPIPMLDGGHLAIYMIEALTGKPLPDSLQISLQQVGLFVLLMVMFLAFFNDLTRLFG